MADYGIDMQSGRVWWLYQARRVATQANAAGGKVIVDISLASGQTAKIVQMYVVNSGNNDLSIDVRDEDTALNGYLATATAAAGRTLALPSPGNVSATGGNIMSSTNPFMLGPGQTLTSEQSGAGAQNDTMTIGIALLLSTSTEPTWSKARSTNQADVTLAASTISTANTLQAVVL